MTVYFAQLADDPVKHVFDSEGRAELWVAGEVAKAKALGRKEPIWIIWDWDEGEVQCRD